MLATSAFRVKAMTAAAAVAATAGEAADFANCVESKAMTAAATVITDDAAAESVKTPNHGLKTIPVWLPNGS